MGLSVFGYAALAILIGAPISAIWALYAAHGRGTFQLLDLGTTLLPPIAFLAIAVVRPELHFGYAVLFWPIIIAVVAMYCLPLKTIAVNLNAASPKRLSTVLFLVCLGSAVLLGIAVPPWYE
jgi:hypothetical protein